VGITLTLTYSSGLFPSSTPSKASAGTTGLMVASHGMSFALPSYSLVAFSRAHSPSPGDNPAMQGGTTLPTKSSTPLVISVAVLSNLCKAVSSSSSSLLTSFNVYRQLVAPNLVIKSFFARSYALISPTETPTSNNLAGVGLVFTHGASFTDSWIRTLFFGAPWASSSNALLARGRAPLGCGAPFV
jgi:hypothetical protein